MDLTFVMTLTSVLFKYRTWYMYEFYDFDCYHFFMLVWLANKTRTITERNELEIKNEVYQMFYLYTETSRTIFLICVKSTLTVS
jgi:hypothetical protein